jgi:hypothetical protein
MDHKEDCELLRENGFAEVEMDRLSRLRRDYSERMKRQAIVEQRRFEFVRWLILTGRLTEHIA